MSQVNTPLAQTIPKKRAEALDSKELKKELKPNMEFYSKVADGIPIVTPDDKYTYETKELARLLLEKNNELMLEYKELYDSIQSVKVSNIRPKLCDKHLTDFFSKHFNRKLPDNGIYGVFDLNKIAPRAFSLYIKEKGLSTNQYFTLNDELRALFELPSVEDPSKSYLQLTQDRIHDIRMSKTFVKSNSSAEVIITNTGITMNYSALKIATPKFGSDYIPANSNHYIPELTIFNDYLTDLHMKRLQDKKDAKKVKKL